MELMLKDYPLELEIGTSMASLQNAMDLQKQLFHSQIDKLKNVVVTQCKLTGVNPLAQEMAAGALSIKIGKRPRDLLNPKAVKYMQAVFSVKDVISKKESREIGALFGLTVTQVKEYFASQRTRVRKMVRLSREKAVRASASKELQYGESAAAEPMLPIEPVPLCIVGPSVSEEAASCSIQDELLAGLGESDKQFVESIFNSMRKEESFSGQVKLMEWILQIENPSVLSWFLTKGGVMILATWLGLAAGEEQTSVLSAVLKVLCHLPLHKAPPDYMSAILQSVNRLRFYRVPDISNRARVLLSKWSKMFAKTKASKKTNGIRVSGTQRDIDLSQRIDELMGDWQPSIVNDGSLVPSYGGPDDNRKLATPEDVKLLTAASDDTNKKLMLGPCSHNKERRKVLLVEQPGQKTASKNQQVKVPANQARPITADEIQKAKIRAQFMQSNKTKTEGLKRSTLLTNDLLSASEAYLRPKLEAQKKARMLPVPPKSIKQEEPESIRQEEAKSINPEEPKSINQEEPKHIKQEEPKHIKQEELLPSQKPILERKESLLDKCRRVQIFWQAPPEVVLDPDWGVGAGENSKEMEVQKNRMRREKETIYGSIQEVPFNPKEPWDTEMDFDDTLTPEIPFEQLPDADAADATLNTQEPVIRNPLGASGNPASTSSQPAAEPDLELLAVLLKNPELVFALTSGQASGISNEDTVKVLDMLKASGGGAALLNRVASRVEASLPSPTPMRNVEVSLPSPTPPSRVEVSLPSPTPSSNLGPSGWSSQIGNNPFSRHTVPTVATTVITADRHQSSSTLLSQTASGTVVPSLLHPSSQPPTSVLRSSSFITNNQSALYNPALNQATPTNSRLQAHSQLSHHPEYQASEDVNMGVLNARHHGLAHNSSSSTRGNENVYNQITRGAGPTMRPGLVWDRNEFNSSRHKGVYESWSPENSPGPPSYVPPEHGHAWRGYRHGPPSDRLGRDRDSPGFREQHWQGGGSVNRRR